MKKPLTPQKPLVTLSSDFQVGSQGCGIMKAVALDICPGADVVHLMHGIPDFDIQSGARTMETIKTIQPGFHVCVVDPGVGTQRKPIIIFTKRGDYLIGPDNGVLMPAARMLGGIVKAVEITNERYMKHPVSPIFHGRDIFTPAAAYLATGVSIDEFGKELKESELVKAPYEEAELKDNKGDMIIESEVICINKFGTIHLNILSELMDKLKLKRGDLVELKFHNKTLKLPFGATFGDVPKGEPLIMKDDYGRVEVAVNQGNFVEKYKLKLKDKVTIEKC